MSFAIQEAAPDLIRDLLDRGGDMHKGELLQHAVDRAADTIEVLGMLLDRGAPLNQTMYQNHLQSLNMFPFLPLGTPLHAAASKGRADVVQYLLRRGADPTILKSKGQTAEACAEKKGHDKVAGILKLAVGEFEQNEPHEDGGGLGESSQGGDSE